MPHAAATQPVLDETVVLREVSGTTRTLTITGAFDLAVRDRFERAVTEEIVRATERVVIDLSSVNFIDSTGICALLRAHRRATGRAIQLVLIPAAPNVHDVFRVCGLDAILPFSPQGVR